MKEISVDQFYKECEKYSKFGELKDNDILIIPPGPAEFTSNQKIYQELSSESSNIHIYTYPEFSPETYPESFPEMPPSSTKGFALTLPIIIEIGTVLVQKLPALLDFFSLLKDKVKGEKFSLKLEFKKGEKVYEIEFEGNFDELKKICEMIKSL